MLKKFISYIAFEKRYSEHTVNSYRSDIQQFQVFVKEQYGEMEFQAIRHTIIRTWLVELIQNGNSNKTVNRKISALKSFFNYLKRSGITDNNPMQKIIAPKIEKRLPAFIQESKIEQLFDTLNESEDFSEKRNRLMIELLYSTGMRRAELIGLKDTDCDPYRKTLRILGKGNKERLVPLSDQMISKIKKYIHLRDSELDYVDHPFLFVTDKGKRMYPKFVYNTVKRYLSMITTQDKKSPHILRHSFATHLSNNGADLNAIKDLLGHASLAATQVYTHNSIERLKKVYATAHPKSKNS